MSPQMKPVGELIYSASQMIREEGTFQFASKATWYIVGDFRRLLLPRYIKKISMQNGNWIEFALTLNYYGLSIAPMQIKSEIEKLMNIVESKRPKRVLEIGTYNGGTLFLFCKFSEPGALIISVDLPKGEYGGGYPDWKVPLFQSFKQKNQFLHLVRADSHSYKTKQHLERILDGRKLDLLFIDGDHSYEGVKKDFDMYSSFVDKGGIIALHDIVTHPLEKNCHVDSLWKELKQTYECTEIVQNANQGWGGIGLVHF